MTWQARPIGSRAIAAAMALGATVALFLLLASGQRRATEALPVGRPPVRLMLLRSARPAVMQPPVRTPLVAAERPPRAAERRTVPTLDPATAPDSAVKGGTTPPEEAVPPVAEAPTAAASAPLKLDEATIRAASAHSVGPVRRLAAASGQALPNSDRSSNERLGSAVAEAVKPDCLAPNERGSLLSLPTIALAAIAGKCH